MEKRTRPYEAVVRIFADGTVAGHQGELEEFLRPDGSVEFARELPVRPLDLAGPEFGPLVEALNLALMRESRLLKDELTTLQTALEAQTQARSVAEGQLAQAVGTVDRLLQQRDALLARVAELDSQKNGEAK